MTGLFETPIFGVDVAIHKGPGTLPCIVLEFRFLTQFPDGVLEYPIVALESEPRKITL